MKGTEEPLAYRRLVEQLLADEPAVGETQMMGMPALKAHGKMFGGSFHERLVVRIGRDRVDELVAAGKVEPFDPSGRGRPMRHWATVAQRDAGEWLALAREALQLLGAPGP